MIRELKTLVAVAREGTFAAAGAKLGLTQAAVSAQMRRLADKFGFALFDRAGRAAKLNTRGAQILLRAQELIRLYENLGATSQGDAALIPVTIGAIAAQMRIDHSRASRIVAELVQRGQLHRDASQQDARRTIVTLTDSGSEILSKMRDVKQESLTHALSDWSEQDLDDFARLYERFMQRMHEQSMAFEDANTGKSST